VSGGPSLTNRQQPLDPAPFYLGLIAGLVLLLIHFARELVDFVVKIPRAGESEVILGVLGLIDLTFTGNLIVIKAFMNIDKITNVSILGWLVGIHLVFVSSMLVLAIVDRLEAASEGTSKRPK